MSMVSTRAVLPLGPRSTDNNLKAALGTNSSARSLGLAGCSLLSLAHTWPCTTCRVTRVGLENGECFDESARLFDDLVRVTTAHAVRRAEEDDEAAPVFPPPSLAAKAATLALRMSSWAIASLQSLKLSAGQPRLRERGEERS